MSFETSAELSLTVNESDLKNVSKQIESEIGTTAVGVTDGGSMSAQSTGSSGGGRGRQARRSMRLAETRTELLEDAVVYLEDIEDKVGGGEGGGAGGVFTELLGSATETAGDAAIEASDTVAETLTQVLTGTASTALGNTISSAITNSTVAVEDTALTVKRPGWLDELTGRNIEFTPTVKPSFEAPEVDLAPDFNLGIPDTIAVDRDPLPVQRDPLPIKREPLPVEEVGPITVQVRGPGGGGEGGSGQQPLLKRIGQGTRDLIRSVPGGDAIADADRRASDAWADFVPGFESSSASTSSRNTGRSTTVDVTHNPTYNVEVDPRRLDQLRQDIVSEIESNVRRDIAELRDDLDELEREFAKLERGIR